jgi:hypothetical protein
MSEGRMGVLPWNTGLKHSGMSGKHLSDDAKKRISEANKGRVCSEESRKRMSEAHKGRLSPNKGKPGKPHTEEWKKMMSEKFKGRVSPMKGRHLSEEHKRKISDAERGDKNYNYGKRGPECKNFGRKQTEEEKEKHRSFMLGPDNPLRGKPAWSKGLTKETDPRLKSISDKLKGRIITPEWREKLSKARKGKYAGPNHPNWQGGLKDNPYGLEYNEKLRIQVRGRDDFKCVLCGEVDEDRELQTHHIDYDKTNNKEDNLFSLCLHCHVKTNFNRPYWERLFRDWVFFIYPPINIYSLGALNISKEDA